MEYDEFDDLVKCPWCTNDHDIVKKRLEIHYSKLKQNNDPCVRHLRTCRYNSHHKFHKKEADLHYAECEDAKKFTIRELLHAKEVASNPTSQQSYSSADLETVDSEENWDNENHVTVKYVPRSFYVADDYRSFYDKPVEKAVPSIPIPKAAVEASRKTSKKNLKPENPAANVLGKDQKVTLESKTTTTTTTTISARTNEIQSATENVEALDDKKQIRKLEKKLKEIKKLEEKGMNQDKPNFTKEELEKMSKKDDIEKLLADLKLNL